MNNNVKLVVKILIIALIVFFFLPVGTVSCGRASVDVTAAHAMVGYSDKELGQLSNPVIVLAFLLIMPIVMLCIGGIRKPFQKTEGIVNLILLGFEILGYMLFKSGVKNYAEDNRLYFSVSAPYYVVIVLAIICIVGYIALFMGIGESPAPNGPAAAPPGPGGFAGNNPAAGMTPAPGMQPAGGAGTTQQAPGWTCTCGKNNSPDNLFCARCGNKRPETAQSADPAAAAGTWTCTCGRTNQDSDLFCAKCGSKKPE